VKAAAHLLLLALAVLALSGCGLIEAFDKNAQKSKKACTTAAPVAMAHAPKLLPSAFPTPSGVGYTSAHKAGPTTIVIGTHEGPLTDLLDAYKSQLSTNGWDVTKSEHDVADAEVNFEGHSTTGQVKLLQQCKTRTKVTLTIRPA
jgi:hypothetical protein